MEPGIIKDGWYLCSCGQKLFKVRADAELKNHVCFCRKCKKESIVDIKESIVSLSNINK